MGIAGTAAAGGIAIGGYEWNVSGMHLSEHICDSFSAEVNQNNID